MPLAGCISGTLLADGLLKYCTIEEKKIRRLDAAAALEKTSTHCPRSSFYCLHHKFAPVRIYKPLPVLIS